MRLLLFGIAAITMGLNANPAAAEDFNDRWSIIPKAHADPTAQAPEQTKQPQTQEPAERASEDRPARRAFSGKASFYSYSKGKTASGSSFDRNQLTAAHRTLPFGTKVRVMHGNRNVVVTINDRGPFVRGRVLDLSLSAARSLGITDGVAQIRAEVL